MLKWKMSCVEHVTRGHLHWCSAFFDGCCGVIWTSEPFWNFEIWNQIQFLQLPYTVFSLRCFFPTASNFFSFPILSTDIHGEKKSPTAQFRCKRSYGVLWLSYCRSGFREMPGSSWHGPAKCGCWFWWWSIKQKKYDYFWCVMSRGKSGQIRSKFT